MRTVSDVLGNSGGNFEFTTKAGKLLKIKFLNLKTMSSYEAKLQNKAIKLLSDQRKEIPEDIFSDMFSKTMDKIASGSYAFGGDICQKSLSTVSGIGDLISLLCDVTPDEAIELLMTEGDSFKIVFDEVVRRSISSPEDDTNGNEKKS